MESLIDMLTAAKLEERQPISISCNYQVYQSLAKQKPDNWDGCLFNIPLLIDESVIGYRIDFE